jgi:ribose transport system permease protein
MPAVLQKWRYRLFPSHLLGEILAKPWTETAIPVIALLAVAFGMLAAMPEFMVGGGLSDLGRQAGEVGFVVLGMALVILIGGIDLSVGSIFALANFCALYLMHVQQWSVGAATGATLLLGAALGGVNGLLIGYLRLRAFLTTLITLIIFRSVYDVLILEHSTAIAGGLPQSPIWDALGMGSWFGIPSVIFAFAIVAVGGHLFLTRLRPGWHVLAIGGSRRAAFNAGIDVKKVVALSYVASGVLAASGAIFFASRLASAGGDIGLGLEVVALTAAVLGGISLGGGKGSVTKAVVGTLTVVLIVNGLTIMGVSGGYNRMVLGAILILAVVIDIKWVKNRLRIVNRIYVSPAYHALPAIPSTAPDCGTPWAQNDRLEHARPIGLGRIESPEDVILGEDDHIYCGSRHGDIVRFLAPDYERMETFAHIGGLPAGLAFDRDRNLHVCVAGMGVYRVTPAGEVQKVTSETNRSLRSVNDDSRLRIPDDLDIAPDGRIFFSEATTRYEVHEWFVDALEARGNGRLICHDPSTGTTRTLLRNLRFPNGICVERSGQSLLFAETWVCTIKRYWFVGPRTGEVETVLENLPGFPDNINHASDGTYWVALCGMRNPSFDLAWQMPEFRRRMTQRVSSDEWLFPNINTGCIARFDASGRVLETLWDQTGERHPMVTSMREHKGRLFISGLSNNRIGVLDLPGRDPTFVQAGLHWRQAA